MGEQRRCEECGKPIDEGKLCSKCQIVDSPYGFSRSEMKELYRQGAISQQEMGDRIKKMMDNPC